MVQYLIQENAQRAFNGTACAGLILRATMGEIFMENALDLGHSTYSSTVALSLIKGIKNRKLSRKGAIALDRMLSNSLGFFLADSTYIVGTLLFSKKKPHLWQERLFHHVLQAFGNLSIMSTDPESEAGRTVRAYMAHGYLFEISQMALRLVAMADPKVQHPMYRFALAMFFVVRILNGMYCLYLVMKSKKCVPYTYWRGQMVGASTAYLLSLFWFVKLVKRDKRYMLNPTSGM